MDSGLAELTERPLSDVGREGRTAGSGQNAANAIYPHHRGDKIRAALRARISARTIPQVFVGSTHVGGCTEVLDAYKAGTLQKLLASSGMIYKQGLDIDPYKFFPAWLHPR